MNSLMPLSLKPGVPTLLWHSPPGQPSLFLFESRPEREGIKGKSVPESMRYLIYFRANVAFPELIPIFPCTHSLGNQVGARVRREGEEGPRAVCKILPHRHGPIDTSLCGWSPQVRIYGFVAVGLSLSSHLGVAQVCLGFSSCVGVGQAWKKRLNHEFSPRLPCLCF